MLTFHVFFLNIAALLFLSKLVRKAEEKRSVVSPGNRIATMPFVLAFSPALFLLGSATNLGLAGALYRSSEPFLSSFSAMFITCAVLWTLMSFACAMRLRRYESKDATTDQS